MSALGKLKEGLLGRVGLTSRLRSQLEDGASFWFHVASSGELEQAIPIMEAVREANPGETIFVSYFSPSAKRGLELETKRRAAAGVSVPWTAADYAPFDFPSSVRRFLEIVRPKSAAFIHREIWPGMLGGLHGKGIPIHLFAAFFPESSRKRWGFYRRMLPKFRFIGTTDEDSAAFLQRHLPNVKVERVGDPRIERVLTRKAFQKAPAWTGLFEGVETLVLSSVWPKDFAALGPALKEVLERFPSWRILVVPHEPHPHFISHLMKWFAAHGKSARLWSHWLKSPDADSPLVVDSVGFLAELYRVASLVFVGGSFVGRVHNVLEPAAYGRPIFTGPFIKNSAEATDLSKGLGLTAAADAEGLCRELLGLMQSPEERRQRGERLVNYLEERRGSGKRYAEILLQ